MGCCMGIWEKITTADSVVDLISKLAEGEEPTEPIEPQPNKPRPKPKPKPPTPKEPAGDLPAFPMGDVVVTDVKYLHPTVRNAVLSAIQECKSSGNSTKIVETYRTTDRQDILYAQGRTDPGNIVTQAQGLESYHNYGLAIDVSPVNTKIVEVFENCGFEWGGRWKTFKDTPHFQMSFGLSVSDLKNLYYQDGIKSVWWYIGEGD